MTLDIFKANPDLKDLTDHFGRTPLIYCILADRVNTAKYLIKSGAQISSGWFSKIKQFDWLFELSVRKPL